MASRSRLIGSVYGTLKDDDGWFVATPVSKIVFKNASGTNQFQSFMLTFAVAKCTVLTPAPERDATDATDATSAFTKHPYPKTASTLAMDDANLGDVASTLFSNDPDAFFPMEFTAVCLWKMLYAALLTHSEIALCVIWNRLRVHGETKIPKTIAYQLLYDHCSGKQSLIDVLEFVVIKSGRTRLGSMLLSIIAQEHCPPRFRCPGGEPLEGVWTRSDTGRLWALVAAVINGWASLQLDIFVSATGREVKDVVQVKKDHTPTRIGAHARLVEELVALTTRLAHWGHFSKNLYLRRVTSNPDSTVVQQCVLGAFLNLAIFDCQAYMTLQNAWLQNVQVVPKGWLKELATRVLCLPVDGSILKQLYIRLLMQTIDSLVAPALQKCKAGELVSETDDILPISSLDDLWEFWRGILLRKEEFFWRGFLTGGNSNSDSCLFNVLRSYHVDAVAEYKNVDSEVLLDCVNSDLAFMIVRSQVGLGKNTNIIVDCFAVLGTAAASNGVCIRSTRRWTRFLTRFKESTNTTDFSESRSVLVAPIASCHGSWCLSEVLDAVRAYETHKEGQSFKPDIHEALCQSVVAQHGKTVQMLVGALETIWQTVVKWTAQGQPWMEDSAAWESSILAGDARMSQTAFLKRLKMPFLSFYIMHSNAACTKDVRARYGNVVGDIVEKDEREAFAELLEKQEWSLEHKQDALYMSAYKV